MMGLLETNPRPAHKRLFDNFDSERGVALGMGIKHADDSHRRWAVGLSFRVSKPVYGESYWEDSGRKTRMIHTKDQSSALKL